MFAVTILGNLRRRRRLRLIELARETGIRSTNLSTIENRKAAASSRARATLAGFFGVDEGVIFEPGGLAIEE